jgi:hypothetical protein
MPERKIPKYQGHPSSAKTPRIETQIDPQRMRVHWSFEYFDKPFRLDTTRLEDEDPFIEIAHHMRSFEGRTWAQIESRADHDHAVSCDKMVRKAQNRLKEIKLDDNSELWRFRFSGKRRIWGIRQRNLFKVIWSDPEHLICPSEMRHT